MDRSSEPISAPLRLAIAFHSTQFRWLWVRGELLWASHGSRAGGRDPPILAKPAACAITQLGVGLRAMQVSIYELPELRFGPPVG